MSLYKGTIVAGGLADYDVAFGISNALTGFIVTQETFSQDDIAHIVTDQAGRVINKISYDDVATCNFTFRGKGALPALLVISGKTFVYGGVTWHVDNITENGASDGLRSWSVTASANYNYPIKHRADTTVSGNPTAD